MLVTFKTAKLAKEKGFDIPCNNGFSPLGEELDNSWKFVCNDSRSIPRPTQSELQKWLREEHNIDVWASKIGTTSEKQYYFQIMDKNSWTNTDNSNSTRYLKFEEALEEGLFEALGLIPLIVRFPMYREEIYVTKI